MSNGFLSKRVKRRDQSGITSDRYEFLGLDQAEPDLGDPIVGPSSVVANPFTGDVTNLYFVASDGSGTRYWTKQTDVVAGGVVTPGSITVRDEGVIVGGVNQVTDINFVGSGVTITSPASWVGAGASSVDIQIAILDVAADGNIGNIQYKGSDGFIQGSDDLFYNASTQRVGLGSAIPRQKLDVQGNVIVSGIVTANELSASTFSVSNFTIDENGLIFNVGNSGVGIGTTLPKATLDVLGTANVTGVLTATILSTPQLNATNINATGVTTTGSLNIGSNEVVSSSRQLKNIASLDAVTTATIESAIANAPNDFTSLNVTGIGTIQTLNVTDVNIIGVATVGLVTASNLNISGIATISDARLDIATVGFITASNSWVSGTSTITEVDADTVFVERVEATNIGIGTTNPRSELDVVGDIRLSGAIYDANGSSGTFGQVLISNATNPVTWGNPSEITAGSATSVTTINTSTDTSYYLTFVPQDEGLQSIYLDTDSLTYNPSTNTLTVDSINTKNLEVEGLSRYTTGIVTTSSKSEVVVDSLDTTLFRSARYNIQINTIGQLTISNGESVTNLISGTNYYPGIYENVSLTDIVGTGVDARATITVSAEQTLSIVDSLNGSFTTAESTLGITTAQSLVFDQVIPPSNYENSRVTNITLTNAGTGYTTVPTFTFDSPIIEGNPVEGVGIGSTATGVVSSMKVTNFQFANSGFVTSLVPTVTIDAPASGTQATANVGYGVSTITVIENGVGYLSIPSVDISGSATAGVSTIFANKLRVTNPGFGYTTGDLGITVIFSSGTAAATNNSFSLPNSHLGFTITDPGIGYTTSPILTVATPQIGINTGLAEATLGIVTFTTNSPGSGYTVSPTISNSPSVTGFAATVGLGVSDYAIQVFGGSGYSGAPTITFSGQNGIGTGAQGSFTSINPDPPNNLEGFIITNPGFGYTVPPTVSITGGGGVGAAVTIRTMIVTDVSINNTGYGVTVVPTSTLSTNPIEFLDFAVTQSGSVGIATTSSVSSVIFSSQGTLGTASTTIISGISTFGTVIRQKTGNVDAINDTTITGIDISNVSVGFAVTGTFVQAGTAVSFVNSDSGGTIGLTTNLTNPSVGFGLTFYISDTLSQRVIVGQGVSGTSIDQTGYGTTVISIGSSEVTLSRAATNSGIETNTFYFGTLVTTPGVFQTTLITGITTTGISTGQRVVSDITSSNTDVSSIGIGSITLTQNTTNTSVATTAFEFYNVTPAAGAGASITASMGIGRVTVGVDTSQPLNLGFGTGYTILPGIAVTAADGITGGSGIVTTSSFGIDTDCITVTNPGIYTSIPSVLINSPGIGGGSAAAANVGIGVSTINATSAGSYTGTKPEISFSGGSPLVSAAATVSNIILNNVSLTNAGSGYTSGDTPIEITFSNVSLGATVGLGVEVVSLTSPGLGYTSTPGITFSSSSFGSNATANATLAEYGEEFSLLPGPGYGNTFVYYIQPTGANTFDLYRNISLTDKVVLGFSTLGNPIAYVGGEVTDVEVTYGGSGYESGDILSASASNLNTIYNSNVGTGFSFTTTNIVQNYQISDLMMLQSVGSANTTADIVEYGGISNLDDLISFGADISGSNARLKVTPKYRDNTIKITRTSITN
jgi:hypothetical protein